MPKQVDSPTRQLQISFDSDNRFRENLRDADFTITFEFDPPNVDDPFELGLLKVGETIDALKGAGGEVKIFTLGFDGCAFVAADYSLNSAIFSIRVLENLEAGWRRP